MKRILALFAIGLIASVLFAFKKLHDAERELSAEHYEERVQAAFDEVLALAKPDEKVGLDVGYHITDFVNRDVHGIATINFSKSLGRSDSEIKATMAHEFGHILAGHISGNSDVEKELKQAQATAIAACLVGQELINEWVKGFKNQNYATRHIAQSKAIWVREEDCRLRAE